MLGGIGERQPAATLDAEKSVGGDQRVAHRALAVTVADLVGGDVGHSHPHPAELALEAFGADLELDAELLVVAHRDPDHGAVVAGKRLVGTPRGYRDRDVHRAGAEIAAAVPAGVELALGGLLPGPVGGEPDLQLGDLGVLGHLRQRRQRRHDAADGAHQHVEEAQLRLDHGLVAALQQALGLRRPGVGAPGGLPVGLRIDATEGPADLVLDRPRAVRVEDVALVEGGADQAVDQLLLHGSVSGMLVKRSRATAGVPARPP